MTLLAAVLLLTQDSNLDKLIRQLDDDRPEARAKAVAELQKIGRPAIEALRKAAVGGDAEVRALATRTIENIEWCGLVKLHAYVGENYEDGATVEPVKIKALSRWFPEVRFYEVKMPPPAAPGGAGMVFGMENMLRSLFAAVKHEEHFTRIWVKGVFCSDAFTKLAQRHRIVLADADAAMDFALALAEAQGAGYGRRGMGAYSRFRRIEGGWEFTEGNMNSTIAFMTDAQNALQEIIPTSPYGQQGDRSEVSRLSLEKLRLEVDLLKKHLEERKK